MNKATVAITVDPEVWHSLKTKFPHQLSTKINDFLHRLEAYSRNDLSRLKKQEIEADLNNNIIKMEEIKSTIIGLKDKLEEIKAEEERMQQEMVDKEKQEQEDMVTCDVCKIPKPNERIHYFPGGKVCNGCYLSEPADSLKPFMKKKTGVETKPGGKT